MDFGNKSGVDSMHLTYSDHMTTQPEHAEKTVNQSLELSRNTSKENFLKKVFFPLTVDPQIDSRQKNPVKEKN